jgi:hypothetical protein
LVQKGERHKHHNCNVESEGEGERLYLFCETKGCRIITTKPKEKKIKPRFWNSVGEAILVGEDPMNQEE